MLNSTSTSPDSCEQDLRQAFLDNQDLFPEITDPKQREEAILGFEQYLKTINDIFMDHLREDGRLDHITEDILLRDEWRKRFEKPADRPARRKNNERRT